MSLHLHDKLVLLSTLSVGVIEIIHETDFSFILKTSLQSAIALLTLIYLVFKILNERKKYKS